MAEERTDGMQAHWERFADDDPMWYIARWNRDWTVEDFFASGKAMVDRMMAWAEPLLPGRDRMLEIGCGLGRTSVHFADRFARVDAIDISEKMIRQARSLNTRDNLHFAPASGRDLAEFEDSVFDMVYSFMVFQHIPDAAVIETYLSEVCRILKPRGVATLQFDTRPQNPLVELYKRLPDPLLPRNHRRFIRRYRRRPEWVRAAFERHGLTVRDETGAGTEEHFILAQKPAV